MKILLVEDNDYYIELFSEQLKALGEVIIFKSANSAINWLYSNDESLDLVVCDHYILRFETELKTSATGDEIYFELRFSKNTTPFIHFSSEPCPELYKIKNENDEVFYCLQKNPEVDLLAFIKQNNLVK